MSPVEKLDHYPFVPELPNPFFYLPFIQQRPPVFRRRSSGTVRHLPAAASLPLPPRSPMASGGNGDDASGGGSDGGSQRRRRYHPPPSSPLVLVTWSVGSVAAGDFAGEGLSMGSSSLWFFLPLFFFFFCFGFLIVNFVSMDEL